MKTENKPRWSSKANFPPIKVMVEGEQIRGKLVAVNPNTKFGTFLVIETKEGCFSLNAGGLLKKSLGDAEEAIGSSLIGMEVSITYLGEKKMEDGKWKGKKAKIQTLEVF